MVIPIQNIYYLLSYAWNKLDERSIVSVEKTDCNRVLDLFAKILSNGMRHILRRGLDRGYIPQTEMTGRLRGRIDFVTSLRPIILRSSTLYCEYDELSYDILHNQIVRTTINRVLRDNELDEAIRAELCFIDSKLRHISLIPLTKKHFRLVQLHSNNFFYDFLLKVCELIFDNLLISEEDGSCKFRDFLQDDKAMGRLFEEFVRNFLKMEQSQFDVGCEIINWQAEAIGMTSTDFLPTMRTDVSLTSPTRKIIIDTKYYARALQTYFDKETIHSANLYQLFAYLDNLEPVDKWEKPCEGILLYPTTDKELDLRYNIKGHTVSIRTINLNQDWQQIHESLLKLVA
jgi:5-methylcytosine-specific restriction enzyme subunit McrC